MSVMAVRKTEAFADGTRYVRAGEWARLLAWFIDFTVFVLGVAVGFVVLAVVDRSQDLGDEVLLVGVLALLFAVPPLYGLCYSGGRALGALLTGTRLVRARDGGRIGAKGPWAMTVRTVLLPLLIIAVVFGGGYADGSLARISIDVARTRQVRETGSLSPRA